jgi:hypothetical protein
VSDSRCQSCAQASCVPRVSGVPCCSQHNSNGRQHGRYVCMYLYQPALWLQCHFGCGRHVYMFSPPPQCCAGASVCLWLTSLATGPLCPTPSCQAIRT